MTLSGTLTASGTLSGGMSRSGGVSGVVSGGQPRILVDGVLKGDGTGNISAAVSGFDYASPIKDEAEGAVAHFIDGAAGPVDDLTIDINPVQAGTGDPSPSNVRAISGWTGATIYQSGADTSDPSTTSISWNTEAGTVYGGTLDVTTGLLTVTRASTTFNGTENWLKSGVYDGSFYLNTGEQHLKTAGQVDYCSHAVYNASLPTGYARGQFGYDGANFVNVNIWIAEAGTTKDQFKAYLAAQYTNGTPLQIVATLKTPLTYQLTPTQVTSLLGENNIWADTGNSKVKFYADTKLYIQQLTQPTEDDMTANANIASGKYFMVGNNLYYSTASIANGAKIIVGTNCNQVTLAAALNAINS